MARARRGRRRARGSCRGRSGDRKTPGIGPTGRAPRGSAPPRAPGVGRRRSAPRGFGKTDAGIPAEALGGFDRRLRVFRSREDFRPLGGRPAWAADRSSAWPESFEVGRLLQADVAVFGRRGEVAWPAASARRPPRCAPAILRGRRAGDARRRILRAGGQIGFEGGPSVVVATRTSARDAVGSGR
jgi:hypothetical protein